MQRCSLVVISTMKSRTEEENRRAGRSWERGSVFDECWRKACLRKLHPSRDLNEVRPALQWPGTLLPQKTELWCLKYKQEGQFGQSR